MNTKKCSPRLREKAASAFGCLSGIPDVNEAVIVDELAKVAAMARSFADVQTYTITFAVTINAKGRRIKCEQHAYDAECAGGYYRGCSGEGDSAGDAIRELIAAMQLRFTHLNISKTEDEIIKKQRALEQVVRHLEYQKLRLR